MSDASDTDPVLPVLPPLEPAPEIPAPGSAPSSAPGPFGFPPPQPFEIVRDQLPAHPGAVQNTYKRQARADLGAFIVQYFRDSEEPGKTFEDVLREISHLSQFRELLEKAR